MHVERLSGHRSQDPHRTARLEMPPAEPPARAGLEVVFELTGFRLIGKPQRHDDFPRPPAGGVPALALVVRSEARFDVAGAAD